MLVRLTIAMMVAATTAGCAVSPLTFSSPYPVHGNPVNPTPAPEYRVVCSTGYGFGYIVAARMSHCSQVIVPVERREVVQVRG